MKPNRLFAIASTQLGGVAHTYGLILDVDAQGVVTGLTPVDFDGHMIYEWRDKDAEGQIDFSIPPHTNGDKALLFPITDATAQELLATMDYLRAGGTKRFHMKGTGAKQLNPDFVRYVRPSDAEGKFHTTCRDFLMNHLLQIGGVPVTDIHNGIEALPAFEHSWDVREFIQAAAGVQNDRSTRREGKMHAAEKGRLFYAYNGSGDFVKALNTLPKQLDGRSIAQTLLEDSAPFYDAELLQAPGSVVSDVSSLDESIVPDASQTASR